MRWSIAVGRYAEGAAVAARSALEEAGVAGTWLDATERDGLVARASDATRRGDGVLVVGGDGTINAVVEGMLREAGPRRLAVLPAGTGSDFARMFALPADPTAAVTRALSADPQSIDVGMVEGEWGSRVVVNEVEAGLGGATTRLAERLPRSWGPRKYELAFWGALPSFGPGPARLVTERRTHELVKGIVVVASNGEFFGGGMRIAPKASIVDGAWDLIVVEAHRTKALTLFPRMKRGLHLTDPAVRRVVTPTFELVTERPWPVEIDGDYVGVTPLRGRIEPAAIMLYA